MPDVAELENLHAMWQEYRGRVVPRDAPPVQLQETRRSFYAGAWAVLSRLSANACAGLDDAAAVAHVESLFKECEAFSRSVGTPLEGVRRG